jgi:anti-sigma factor RsiW
MSTMGDRIQEHEITRYLLGDLPEKEREHFDELSVSDDEFAARLNTLENDLIDTYVRDELNGETLQHFQSRYLATPARRERVQMARLLYLAGSSAGTNPIQAENSSSPHSQENIKDISSRSQTELRRPVMLWGLLAAVMLLSVSTGWLAFSNYRLRHDAQDSQDHSALKQREQQLKAQLETQRSVNGGAEKEHQDSHQLTASRADMAGDSARDRESPAKNVIGSFLLLPQLRGSSELSKILVQGEGNLIRLRLQLESDDFPQYRVALRNLMNDQVVWHSGNTKSTAEGGVRIVSVLLPIDSVDTRNYAAELVGVQPGGQEEIVGSYPFHFVKNLSR